jgi:transmembrane sensor
LMERLGQHDNVNLSGVPARRRILYFSAAASLALLISVLIVLWDFNQVKIVSGTGEQKVIALPDGSEIYLNAVSSVRYSEKNFLENRTLQLNGEAYFEVKEGSLFTVESRMGTIKVLGTSFNVHSREDYFNVCCLSGSIIVTAGNITDTIGSRESISLINGKYLKAQEPEFEKTIFWRTGEFYYKSTDLRFVLDEIERQFGVSIEASGIENRRFTGSFYSGSLEEAIQIVCIAMDLEFEFIEEGKIRISP